MGTALGLTILTLFPEMFSGVLTGSILGRAQKRGLLTVRLIQIRDFAPEPHRRVDDTPYGGGPGMVLRPDVLDRALLHAVAGSSAHVVMLTPQGSPFDQEVAKRFARMRHIVLVCGHYEGVDERVTDTRVNEEISLGDFVLTGGEIAAMAVVDAVARLVPGVLGDAESYRTDSFYQGVLDHPHYTRPESWAGHRVPQILRSGNHGAVAEWRRRQSLLRTLIRRPDLLGGMQLTKAESRLVKALAQDLDALDQEFVENTQDCGIDVGRKV
ncbi:MAG: tRNA (guanosine(37)-N1)-methyltransferase TrmD [Magnetococcales bacterium]|nr:tRNA (guanosine(37)-N1)-methyltransferase TrmD [Magnetococcales bacterium]